MWQIMIFCWIFLSAAKHKQQTAYRKPLIMLQIFLAGTVKMQQPSATTTTTSMNKNK